MLGVRPAGPLGVAEAAAPFDPVDVGANPSREPAADPYAAERDAWTVLTAIDRLGPIAFAALLGAFGSGREMARRYNEPSTRNVPVIDCHSPSPTRGDSPGHSGRSGRCVT